MKDVQFTPYEISMCLYDVDRTRIWKEAIEDIVNRGDVVVDAGAGTGILGVFAALDGASQVYAIEIHPRFCKLIENLAKKNEVENKVKVIHGNAAQVELEEEIDVLICELLCTGQFFEPEVQVYNQMRKYFKKDTKVIPQKVESYIQLIDAQKCLYGVRIDTDSRSTLFQDDEPVSTKEKYDEINFNGLEMKEAVDTTVVVRARKSRIADAVVINSRSKLTNRITTQQTKFLYNPEVIFLKEPIELVQGEYYDVKIKYPYGCDTLDVSIDVKIKNK